MFRTALAAFARGDHARKSAAGHLTETGPPRANRAPVPPAVTSAALPDAPTVTTHARTVDGRVNVSELATEPERIERLSAIREFVFGAQDGLVSTFAVVAGIAAAGAGHLVVMLAGAVSAVAGVLAMSIGTFLSSRALRQVYEGELARERHEIREHPGEETAELIASLMSRGMSRGDAVEVGRRIARHPELLLTTLGVFELGLAPQRLGTPVRDAFVMAAAFGGASLVPVLAFVVPNVMVGLGLAAAFTVVALFVVGVVKGRVARVSPIRSGLEVVVLGLASGVIGFGLGRLVSVALGVQIA
jgi:VIT1/CCC1 family predicted Fe2+/Mn2+ transporter